MADKRADQLKEITERLEQGVKDIFTSEMYTKYLLTMSKFHNYSFNNTLLIAMQRPDATLVAGYNAWKNKFNRYVKKGEKGIQIIAPAPVKEREEREKIDKDTGLTVLNESGEPEIEVVERVIPRFRVTTVFDYPKELIKFNGFFTKLPNGEYLLLNEEGYQVEGQKGTWTVTDEKTIDEQRFVLMVNDQKPDLLPSIVVQSDGKFITSTASGFDNATVRKVRELLHHEKFLENGTAERARESGTEQNYNMIDGCVNNVPKKPRVIGGRVSVLDRLHIKQAERARKDNAQVQQQERTRKN